MKTRSLLPLLLLATACGQHPASTGTPAALRDGAFVQLFEWRWPDVALECEQHLGPAGYTAVQVSPPQEHIPGPQWWTRYQPVSYRVESRGGTRAEFAEMVSRCKAAGVGIYADAVINHMADVGVGAGVAGSRYTEFSYPVPYEYDEFHHCGRNGNRIGNYQDAWEVQNCQLGGLADLDTGRPSVQAKLGAYLNDLLSLGVAGFRLDAVKHIAADDMRAILARVDGSPVVFQEVIDRGGEPITAEDYAGFGLVTEFRFASVLVDAFLRHDVEALGGIGGDGWLAADQAVVFIDNHDSQRSHLGDDILNYKNAGAYDLATVFTLAYPYGYPVLMSSYAFDEDDDPVPVTSPHDPAAGCGSDWVCEHRRPLATTMIAFRRAVAGAPLRHMEARGNLVSFARGSRGHIVINVGDEPLEARVATSLADGAYESLLQDGVRARAEGNRLRLSLAPRSAAVFLAEPG